jgi:hypothetical protein
MSFALEQFLSTLHLRVATILDLEPGRALRRVRSEAVLGNDALKIHLAHTLKQCRAMLLNMIGVAHPKQCRFFAPTGTRQSTSV